MRKMAGWKAPGPDKIHGWNHKAFPRMNTLLKEMMWEIMDKSGTLPPGWLGERLS